MRDPSGKRFAGAVGPGAAAFDSMSDERKAKLHEIAVGSAEAMMAQMAFLCAQAATIDADQAVNSAASGALHGFCRHAWGMRKPGMTREALEAILIAGIRHGLEQADLAELRGGPVAGHG